MFLLVGATFLTASFVQSQRGHIGIEAFVGVLSPLCEPDTPAAGGHRIARILHILFLEILDTDP